MSRADTISYLRYVPGPRLAEWEALGWRHVDDGKIYHHDHYSCLCEWKGEGEPPIPVSQKQNPELKEVDNVGSIVQG